MCPVKAKATPYINLSNNENACWMNGKRYRKPIPDDGKDWDVIEYYPGTAPWFEMRHLEQIGKVADS